MAILTFGTRRFRLRVREDVSAIEVSVEGRRAHGVLRRLIEHVENIMGACMKALLCFPAVSYVCGGDSASEAPCLLNNSYLIPLSQITAVVETHSVLNRPDGKLLISGREAQAKYSAWFQTNELFSSYDVFLNHGEDHRSSSFSECLYDRFSLYTVDSDARDIRVYLQNASRRGGSQLHSDAAKSLCNASVAVLVVSCDELHSIAEARADRAVVAVIV